jgi:hypothetical protein
MTPRRNKTDKNKPDIHKDSGFYAHQFSHEEIIDLEAMIARGLDDEIAMLRVVLRRYYTEACGCQTLEEMGEALVKISLVATRLASLVKVQQSLGAQGRGDFSELFSQALAQINVEMGLSG